MTIIEELRTLELAAALFGLLVPVVFLVALIYFFVKFVL